VYALLFAVWLGVLTHKIREGPHLPAASPAPPDDLRGFFDSAAERPDRSGTMTEAKPPGRRAGEGGAP
jgi:hypothetical protein